MLLAGVAAVVACGSPAAVPTEMALTPRQTGFLDTLEQRTFAFFWERSDSRTGLTPDRWPTPSFSSVAAVGFALTAYPIGVERGYITRGEARERVLRTLRFFWTAPQGPAADGVTGHQGFFYHFLDMRTGSRFNREIELSTIDTSLLLAGVLFCQSYFDGPDEPEEQIRAYADSIYRRVNWRWIQPAPPKVSHAWSPEDGFSSYNWSGYDEAMILYILALGSPTHPIDPAGWDAYTATYRWGEFQGRAHVGFAPLFGHQYSHIWIDFRGIRDAYMRERELDYFENSRLATYAQRDYAIQNPLGWRGYGAKAWGLTASDGPTDDTITVRGIRRPVYGYAARGASFTEVRDDGTIAPTAVAGSLPFSPEITLPTLIAMREQHGDQLFGEYGFLDAFNLSIPADLPVKQGRTVSGRGWYDTDYLGIDQGPILAMVENFRTGLIWRYMRRNPYLIRGLQRAGFTGGWLDQAGAPAQ
jgi:hypothetical protein